MKETTYMRNYTVKIMKYAFKHLLKSREKDQVPISRYIAQNKMIQLTVIINLDHLKTVYLKTPDTSFWSKCVYISKFHCHMY